MSGRFNQTPPLKRVSRDGTAHGDSSTYPTFIISYVHKYYYPGLVVPEVLVPPYYKLRNLYEGMAFAVPSYKLRNLNTTAQEPLEPG
jgi:hypothetical protein